MKNTILGLSQKKLVKLKLTHDHALLIRYFIDFRDSMKVIQFDNGDPYYELKYKTVLKILPILRIKKEMLRKKFKDIINAKILEFKCEKSKRGSFSLYRAGPNLEKLLSGNKDDNDLIF